MEIWIEFTDGRQDATVDLPAVPTVGEHVLWLDDNETETEYRVTSRNWVLSRDRSGNVQLVLEPKPE